MQERENQDVLDALADFEKKLGREQTSLVYAFLATTGLDADDIEVIRERTDSEDPAALRIRVEKKNTARSIEELEGRLARANKLLSYSLPKLVAHRRLQDENAQAATTPEEESSFNESVSYMDELIGDVQTHLNLKFFGDMTHGKEAH